MFERFFRARRRAPAPLHGAPAVQRQKTYSAQSGSVYQYYYEGYRHSERVGRPGHDYVFQVSSDRKSSFPMTIFLPSETVEAWQHDHGRRLSATEQYAAVKMALFEAFDERPALDATNAEVDVDHSAIERLLGALEIE